MLSRQGEERTAEGGLSSSAFSLGPRLEALHGPPLAYGLGLDVGGVPHPALSQTPLVGRPAPPPPEGSAFGSSGAGFAGQGATLDVDPFTGLALTAAGLPTVGAAPDVPASIRTSAAIAIGRRLSGVFQFSGDRDWFRVTLKAGHTYRFDLTGNGVIDPNLALRDAKGSRRAFNDDASGPPSQITYKATVAGTYYLDAGSSTKGSGTYTLEATDITPKDDFGATAPTSGSIAVGRRAKGAVHFNGDRDWFRVELRAGRSYRFNLTGDKLLDCSLALRDAKGSRRAFNDDANGRHPQITYKATVGGIYYLDAGAAGKGTGTYTLQATDTTPKDDFGATTATKGSIAVGGSATGVVEFSGDRDWFRLSLGAGRTYRFTLNGTPLSDPTLALRDASGSRRAFNDDSKGRNSQITFTSIKGGIHYLDAGAYGKATGSYTLQVADITPKDDFAATTASTGAIVVGRRVSGAVNFNGDRDWFRVDLQAGRTYRFNLKGTRLSNPSLALRDASGSRRAFNDDSNGRDSQITFTPSAAGTFFLDAGASSSGSGAYLLQATDATPTDDFAATTATTGRITIGRSTSGLVQFNGDRDWFRVDLQAGRTYRFNLNGKRLSDPLLRLRDGNGVDVAFNDDSNGRNSQIVFTPTAAGPYYLDAGAYSVGTGSYALLSAEITPPPPVKDDYGATISTAGSIAMAGSASGVIDVSRDRDWFEVALQQGRTYRFTLSGVTLADPTLRLRDAEGRSLAFNNDFNGRNAQITFTARRAGPCFLDAGANGTGTGSYKLEAADITLNPSSDDVEATTSTTGALSIGGLASGVINFNGDRDWFRMTLQAGRAYTFAVEGDSLRDPDLYLRDANGLQVGYSNNSGGARNPILNFSPVAGGVFYFDVGSDANIGTGSYRLSAKDNLSDDDFAANGTTTGTVAIGASTSGRINFNGDHDWFLVSLEANSSYQFALKGTSLKDLQLALRDASGSALMSNGTSNDPNSQIIFTTTAAGTYYLDVGASLANSIGDYTLSADLATVTIDDYLADPTTAGSVSVGGQTSGAIDFAEDHDWFSVSLRLGRQYRFNLTGNTLADPVLSLRDATGRTILASNDNTAPGLNAQLTFTATKTGLHFLDAAAKDLLTGSYLLHVTDVTVEPDRITGLQEPAIRTQVNSLLLDNLFSHQDLSSLLRQVGRNGVSAAELTDLRTIAKQFRPFLASDQQPYYAYIYNAVVNGNPANQWWTGGGASRTALGNLTAGSLQLRMDRLVDKWFGGLDLPTNIIEGDAAAGRGPLTFSYAAMTGGLFVDDVRFDDVNQGAAGTCYFLASCSSLAESNKQLIHAMFKDNGDGTYGVRFYGATGNELWVTVNRSVPYLANENIMILAGNASWSLAGEMWVALAEKAYAQANETGAFGRSEAANSFSSIEGGLGDALQHITGLNLTTYSVFAYSDGWIVADDDLALWNSYEDVAIAAIREGHALWLGSFGTTFDFSDKINLVGGHAFAILGYNADHQTFIVANPWGPGSLWAGVFEASWQDFYSVLAVVSWV
jgi:hypothetical protein